MARPSSGYRLANGTRVPGVTTIIGRFKDSGALMHWACKQGQLIERGVIKSLYDKAEQAADIGTVVHDWIEDELRGNTLRAVDLEPESLAKATEAFGAFSRWQSLFHIEPVLRLMEAPLVSETYEFGGTPDCPAIVADKEALLDWKSSRGFYRDMVIQMGAYRHLLREAGDFNPQRAYIARFDKAGRFAFHELTADDLDLGWQQFLAFRSCYERDKALKEIAA